MSPTLMKYLVVDCRGYWNNSFCSFFINKNIFRHVRLEIMVTMLTWEAIRLYRSGKELFPVKSRIHFKICTITFWTKKDNQPAYVADLLVHPKCSKYLRFTNSNRFSYKIQDWVKSCPYISNNLCPYVMPKQCQHCGNYLNLTYFIKLSYPSSSVASIMTHDHANKALCYSELSPLSI